MFESVALGLILLWVILSLVEVTFGGAIHVLLLLAAPLLLVEWRRRAKKAAMRNVTPAGILAIVLGRPRRDS